MGRLPVSADRAGAPVDVAEVSRRVLEGMPVAFIGLDADWRIVYVNAAGEAVVGQTRERLVGADYWEAFPANVDNAFGQTFRRVAATGQPEVVEAFYPEPLNTWFEVRAVPQEDGGLNLFFTEVDERRRAQERLAVLARVSAELAGTLDAFRALPRVPRLLVPQLGHWAVLTVIDPDGRPRDVGSWHEDDDRRALLARYVELRLSVLPATAPVVQALHRTEPMRAELAEVVELLPDGEARDLLLRFVPSRAVLVPLLGRGRVLGVLTVGFDGHRDLPAAELTTVREVAGRIGLALDNSRLHRQQAQLAEDLQRSLLSRPFEPDHAQIVVRYTPAAEAARVGGDWYDAFLQPSGALVLVIGDVIGHDTAAAAAMGQLRALLRGVATYSDAGPSEVLRGLDASMSLLQVGTYATATVARLEQTPEEAERGVTRMLWATAGHFAPLVVQPDGVLQDLPPWKGDLMLGVDSGTHREEAEVVLRRGATVLLFTDGLIERRDGDLDTGMGRLRQAVAELADRPLDELCDEVLDRLVQGRPDDDVAIVAARLHPRDRDSP
jgi:PAS domain S-box-containing protein